MTPFTIAKTHLLPYIGVYSFDPAVNAAVAGSRGLSPFDLDFCADCMTQAAEELFRDAPAALSESQWAGQIYAPTTVTIGVTNAGTAFTGLTTFAAWMVGCTIDITGDGTHNVIMSGAAGAGQLLRPYQGTTGTVSATVYCDAIALPATIKTVMDPVRLPTIMPLLGVTNRDDFFYYGNPHRYGNRRSNPTVYYTITNKTVGQPAIWLAEDVVDLTISRTTKYMRFNPMPNQAYTASARVKLKAPVFTAAMIQAGTDYTTDPAAIIPMDSHASTFLPIVKQMFTAHPSFNNPIAAKQIMAGYQAARATLMELRPMSVSEQARYR